MRKIKTFYRRNLPHIQPVGAAFFVTFRLYGSIPYAELEELKNNYRDNIDAIKRNNPPLRNKLIYERRKRYFGQYDQLLDKIKEGPMYLGEPEIAELVAKELERFDGEFYDLIGYCIMSNHVHLLIDTALQVPEDIDEILADDFQFTPLDRIMKRVKGPTAVYANRALGRSGQFWSRESFDHYIRNERELTNVISYILENPVKAGLVKNWEDWAFSFLKDCDV